MSSIRRYWTRHEDKILHDAAVAQLSDNGVIMHWNHVSAKLPGRTNKDCRKRWNKLNVNVKKGSWSPEEDNRLREAIAQHGFRWTIVAQHVQTRHGDQCAKRWCHFLDPNLTHEKWEPEDDERLLEAVRVHGRSWKVIRGKIFPQRSATDLKNRFIILQRKSLKSKDSIPSSESTSPESDDSHSIDDITANLMVELASSSDTNTPAKDEEKFPFFYEFMSVDTPELHQLGSSTPTSLTPSPNSGILSSSEGSSGFTFADCHETSCHDEPSLLSLSPLLIEYGSIPAEGNNKLHLDNCHPCPRIPSFSTDDISSLTPPKLFDIYSGAMPTLYTLELEDLQPQVLSRIMGILLKSQRQFNMKFVRENDSLVDSCV